jgi:hypothetical protein
MSNPSPATPFLPAGVSLQDISVRVAAGVCEAYAAYNNGSNLTPVLPGYNSIQTISVHEAAPNGNPFSGFTFAPFAEPVPNEKPPSGSAAQPEREEKTVPRSLAAYSGRVGASNNPCTGPIPLGTPVPGYQLFGFTATADDGSHNLLVFRGTVTMQEAVYDLLGWGNNVECNLPSQSWWWDQKSYGFVNSYLLAFYANGGIYTTLAASCINAIKATIANNPNVPWYIGAHSLGGAMISLAALDAVVSGLLNPGNTYVVTFGSLHVGAQSFADAYNPQVPLSYRIANLCDFVPSMVSLEPVIPADPYVHVGYPGSFVWQTWDDWGNHSLANIYQPMVLSHWDIIKWSPRQYPQ